jgi:hypothetical protein
MCHRRQGRYDISGLEVDRRKGVHRRAAKGAHERDRGGEPVYGASATTHMATRKAA